MLYFKVKFSEIKTDFEVTNPQDYTGKLYFGKLCGNASTASKLENPVMINGIPFDGSEDITIEDNTKLPRTGGTVTGEIIIDTVIVSEKAAVTKEYVEGMNINGGNYNG